MNNSAPSPSAEDVLAYLEKRKKPITRQGLCRHFKVKGDARRELRALLKQLKNNRQVIVEGGFFRLPTETEKNADDLIIDVTVSDAFDDNEEPILFCTPIDTHLVGQYPLIVLDESVSSARPGEVVTVKLTPFEEGGYKAAILARPETGNAFLGTAIPVRDRFYVRPFSKNMQGTDFELIAPYPDNLKADCVVRAKAHKRPSFGPTPAELVEVIGETPAGLESSIAIDNHGLPVDFPNDVVAEAEALPAALTKTEEAEREDLRQIPIVTIDGADAKDFDDAVWAEPTKDGFHIIVAIADVAQYIHEGSELDLEALKRGNSTYFPDRVVPMLPERLSNDLCSLRPHEDRPVLAVHMHIDQQGKLKKYTFVRAIIHSHARLTYEQVQAAANGDFDEVTKKLWPTTLQPLYQAFEVLLKARAKRGALDLDLPESQIEFNDNGEISGIGQRERLDSHRLIEEFMVLANVAAASALESKGAPCLYRIHPEPSNEKLENLKLVLKEYDISAKVTAQPSPKGMSNLIDKVRSHPEKPILMQSILQSQQQAKYDPENIGHFGLALQRYAHFTSPIRRYSDLLVHRSLIKTLKLADKGALTTEAKKFHALGEHLCETERRSQQAEWEARDRIITRFYRQFIGQSFEARVRSVQKFGMFVAIDDVAEGLLPLRLMKNDRYVYNEKTKTLRGLRKKEIFKIGSHVMVELIEASPTDGRLTFAMVSNNQNKGVPPQTHHKKRSASKHKKGSRNKK